jgi:hypothetical protein
MSKPSKQVELTRSQERQLDEFARASDFWSRIRAAYADYGGLTEKQYALFERQREKDAWKADAQRLNGVPIRNRFRTSDGKPRCADRSKPYCESEATIIVGSFAFCTAHAASAKEEYDGWLAGRREIQAQERAAEQTGSWGSEFDSAEGEANA